MARPKFYAVRRGREGVKIYTTWIDCDKNVSGWPGARYKSFLTHGEALAWLEHPDNSYVGLPPSTSNTISTRLDMHDYRGSPSPATPDHIPIDIKPFTVDFIPLTPGGPDAPMDAPRLAVQLSEEQEHILELVRGGTSLFFTGSAGTGKSVLLREIINHFGGKASEELAITASTGIAAVNIGGTTLHSFAGIGLGTENVERLLKKILSSINSKRRWRRTRTLIIDEISMVDGSLFDKLETIARLVRDNMKPFGGIQLVLSGDFCQLPPVQDRRNDIPIRFAFEAGSWTRCFGDTRSKVSSIYQLTKVFRQRDQDFVDMLNSMRTGQLDGTTIARFRHLSRPINYPDGLEPCELFPLREQVNRANQTRLQSIEGAPRPYKAMDVGGRDMYDRPVSLDQVKKLLDRLIAPELIELKVGAQVMLIKNMVQGHLVNGSLGQVIDFQSLQDARVSKTEIAQVDHSTNFETWRYRQEKRIDVPKLDMSTGNMWPVVRFMNGRTLLLTPVDFEVVNVYGDTEARRDQIPLILAWALSIHKSQGQTLERVKVDLEKIFEKGQAYVALSRATSMDGLQVLNFHPSKVMAHPRVLAWQAELEQNQATQPTPTPEQFNATDGLAKSTGHEKVLADKSTPSAEPYDEFDDFDTLEDLESYWAVPL